VRPYGGEDRSPGVGERPRAARPYAVDDIRISIIGAAKESRGLLLFRSMEDFLALGSLSLGRDESGSREDPDWILISLSFDSRRDHPASMLKESDREGWPVAGRGAYPTVFTIRPGGPEPSSDAEVRLVTACTAAFVEFFRRHGDELDSPDFPSISESHTVEEGVTVTLTPQFLEPAGEADFEDDDQLALFAGPRPEVGRNDPCPCGSGRKYKKCHLDADREAGGDPTRAAEIAALMIATKNAHYERWIDDSIPALGGKSPREMARTRRGKEKVKVLLQQIRDTESSVPPEHRFDVRRLYRELGIDVD
jgi:hypothetical protein